MRVVKNEEAEERTNELDCEAERHSKRREAEAEEGSNQGTGEGAWGVGGQAWLMYSSAREKDGRAVGASSAKRRCAFETAWLPAASRSALCPAGHGRPPAEASRLLHLWTATAGDAMVGPGQGEGRLDDLPVI